jgi:polyisoprenyl-teichoic acid--peptidoglycan teichoic acid transferase
MRDRAPIRSRLVSTGASTSPRTTRSQRAIIATAVVLFAAVSAYLALIIITHVDSIFFPGNEVTIPGGSVVNKVLPLVDATGDSGPKDRINILVVGIDQRPQEEKQNELTRTDTIEVVSVDPKTKSASILGIPRDMWVEIPYKNGNGTYEDRVNTALVEAQAQDYPQGPIGLMKEVIENNFGVKIDKYVMVDFSGFKDIIDGLGGIDVNVPDEVYDPYYSESEKPGDYDPQHFYPGVQHMNGSTALAYSRIRFSSDDLDRIQRQQRVIFATIEAANSAHVLTNAVNLWNEYKDTIQTDISDSQIPGYALLAKQVEDNIHAVSLGPGTTPCTHGQASVLCWSKSSIDPIVQAVFTDHPDPTALPTGTTEAAVLVQVQNGTGTDKLASNVVDFLASKGYPVNDLLVANAFDGKSHSASEILDMTGTNRGNAYLIADWLKIPVARVRDATAAEKAAITGSPGIVVLLGTDGDFGALTQSAPATPAGG